MRPHIEGRRGSRGRYEQHSLPLRSSCETVVHLHDNNNNIDFYIAHTLELKINALFNKNMHTK